MSYRIVTDTCCDFPEAMYDELMLSVVPLTITYQGKTMDRFDDATTKALYDAMRDGATATTAAVNPDSWAKAMEPVLEAGEDVLVMAFSSGLSTTYQSAVIAAQELGEKYPQRKILVVDTLAASLGQGMYVYYACKQRDAGMSLEELADWCEKHKQNICHWFTVDDLVYLKRGGRVSAATALLGSMLQIKPVLHVDNEGHLVSVSKVRGRKASLDALVKQLGEKGLPGENDTVFISHGDCLEDAQYVANQAKEKYGVKNVIISYVGAVIGSHSGPGTVAFFFLGKER